MSFSRADQNVDFGYGYGLGQMMIEPGLARPAPVVVLAISADGHEQYVGKPWILTKPPRDLWVAVTLPARFRLTPACWAAFC